MNPKVKANDAETALKQIAGVQPSDCDVFLTLASLSDEHVPEFQRVVISKAVAREFRDLARNALKGLSKSCDSDDLVLREYDPGTLLESHEVESFRLSDDDPVANQIRAIGDPRKLGKFGEDDDFIEKLRFYVTTLKPKSGKPIMLFRLYSRKKELGRSTLFAITRGKGQYDTVNKTMFLFDQIVDCVVCGDWLFVLNKDRFQKIFRYYEELARTAKETLKVIEAHVPIDDFPGFQKACEGQLQRLAKVRNIANRPYLKNLTIDILKKVIVDFNLPIKTVGTGQDEKIKYDPSDKWAILRLLDDDYLKSVMTGLQYEANSKRAIG
jgi:hypothetical protein